MKTVRAICAFLALLLMFAIWPVPNAFAAGVSVSAPGNVTVGDSVRVSVTFTGPKIMGVNASFSYDSSVLSFAGGSSSVSNGKIVLYASEGKDSLSVSFSFTAIAAGTSRISVSIDECLDEGMNSLGGGSGAATVNVGTEAPKESKQPVPAGPTPKPTPTPVPIDQREIRSSLEGSTVYVWHTIPDRAEVPEGYSKSEAEYHGERVETLSREQNGLVLVYSTDAKGENSQWALLRGDMLLPYITMTEQIAETVVLPLPEDAAIPEGFTKTEVSLGERKIKALESEGDPDSILLYAWGPDDKEDWFLTDRKLSRITRFRQVVVEKTVEVIVTPKPTATPRPTPVPTQEPVQKTVPEDEGVPSPSTVLPWALFGAVAAALAGSWIFFRKDSILTWSQKTIEWWKKKLIRDNEDQDRVPMGEGEKDEDQKTNDSSNDVNDPPEEDKK
ncbi:MAG: hypothetical protein IJT00_04160 [Lachnospiraceae bacterium]|nr:hypothetical protein [Lachnospiraceae bacterium]